MARAIWNGAISFGLVTIPVQLVSAVRNQRPRFHLLHAKDESPVRYQRVCEREEKPVPWDQIVKGYEYEKGEYAVLEKRDFERAALEKTDTIDVLSFVPAAAIDSRYYETPYYLAPGKGADRAYALLRETIRKTGKVGVVQLILRQSQHLAALSVKDDVFVLTLLRLADDRGAAGRRPGRPVEARAVQRSVRGEPVRDHRGEDQGQGGEAPVGRDRPQRTEGPGRRPDGAPAREPLCEHERAGEAARQGAREGEQEGGRPRAPSRRVSSRVIEIGR